MLSTGSPGTLEIQIGARAFVRAWANTQLGLAGQEPDFIQFTLVAGSAVLDLRALEPGETVEMATPNAAVTIRQAGYYRVDTTGERSRVMAREGGRATVTPASGQAVTITPSEELVIEGTASAQLAAYAAPPLDDWDRWNYTRTDRLLDAVSARYVSSGTYGLSDLDPHGTWRVVPTYGTVWVPTGVPAGWTPYSTGSWILDPVYGWTWVDTAPWGWAPYHHGRWCFVNGYWAWAPGPVIARPVYAPALVAFFGDPGGVVIGPGPAVGWVALGWGEPVVPWWGRRGVAHGPSWRGWGGPRVVNNVVVSNITVVNVQNITVYRNAIVPPRVVAVHRARFGRGPITHAAPRAGGRAEAQAAPGRAADLGHAGELRADAGARRPTAREDPRAAGDRDAARAPRGRGGAGEPADRAVSGGVHASAASRRDQRRAAEAGRSGSRPPFGGGRRGAVERPMPRIARPRPHRPDRVRHPGDRRPSVRRRGAAAGPAASGRAGQGAGEASSHSSPTAEPAAALRPRPSAGHLRERSGWSGPGDAIPDGSGAIGSPAGQRSAGAAQGTGGPAGSRATGSCHARHAGSGGVHARARDHRQGLPDGGGLFGWASTSNGDAVRDIPAAGASVAAGSCRSSHAGQGPTEPGAARPAEGLTERDQPPRGSPPGPGRAFPHATPPGIVWPPSLNTD